MTYLSVRWGIAALLCAATTINYIDRQTLSILSPLLRKEFQLSEQDYANIVTAFLVPYTIMYALGGRLMDRFGVKLGLSLALGWWSTATMLTAFARSALSLGAFRFMLGIGEPCVYPAGVKVCGEWFPARTRGIATGIFSSGSTIGAIAAPPLTAWITLRFGWQYAFLIPGALGILWLPLWWMTYRPQSSTNATEPGITDWRNLIRQRRVWGLVLPRFFSDPVWYFYIFWLPDYLQRERQLSLAEIGFYGWIPFLFADVGHLGGGALSDFLIRRGMNPPRARLAILTAVGCLAPVGALAGVVPTAVTAIAVTCLVAMLTQAWSTNTASLCADLIPNESTATVFGLMGMAGSLAGAFFAQILGLVISTFGYPAAFVLAAMLHPIAALILRYSLRNSL
ncbi:MAG: MFS transporter [Bryobacter sp.]|jgi:ACS family hexuronate transporter-like MFS transporter|nr:MFS transporter [Bryobacter sp. CoA8 C33]